MVPPAVAAAAAPCLRDVDDGRWKTTQQTTTVKEEKKDKKRKKRKKNYRGKHGRKVHLSLCPADALPRV